MEIKIKYKEVDKVNAVKQIIAEVIEVTRHNHPIGATETARLIDTVYKENNKLIDSVDISRTFIADAPIRLIKLDADKRALVIEQAYQCIAVNKEELSQYISILTAIEKQMEG
jgi:hypothetical protein